MGTEGVFSNVRDVFSIIKYFLILQNHSKIEWRWKYDGYSQELKKELYYNCKLKNRANAIHSWEL